MLKIDPRRILSACRELSWLSEATRLRMAELSVVTIYHSRELVFHGRGPGEDFVVVVSGNLRVLRCTAAGEQLMNVLYEGDTFEGGFLHGRRLEEESLVVAGADSLLLVLPVAEMCKLITASSEDHEPFAVLGKFFEAYRFVQNSTTFGQQLSPRFCVEFVGAFERRVYGAAQTVFTQGDDPDGYYICLRGQLSVTVVVGGQVVFRGELKAGDYFGELALTTDSKRSATIAAIRETECYFLSRAAFERLVRREPRLLEGFRVMAKLAYK